MGSPPSKPLLNRDGQHIKGTSGKAQWVPTDSLASRELRDRWSDAVIEALRAAYPTALAPESVA